MSGTLSMSSWICHEKRKLAVWILIPLSQKIFSLFSVRWERRDYTMQKHESADLEKWKSAAHKSACRRRAFHGLRCPFRIFKHQSDWNSENLVYLSWRGCKLLLFGLWPNVLAAFLVDLLGYLAHPVGPYMPLFALTAILNAVIYSVCFYGMQKISLKRVALAKGMSTILCNIVINPILLSMLYGTPFWVLMSERLVKNLILFPIETAMLYFVIRECIRLKKRIRWLN